MSKLYGNTVLTGIPSGLRTPLLQAFEAIVRNYRESRWEPAELNGGKLCEIVYTILRGRIDGSFAPRPAKPKNMVDACKTLENADAKAYSRSIRIHIPRTLVALYEVRNNRGVGHAGGDVDPNHMDAVFVLQASKWIMAELVRVFHEVDTMEASKVVDTLTSRTLPLIWEVGNNKRVLNTELSMKDKALALLYSSKEPVSESDLFKWVEHSNPSVFRRDVLTKAHKAKLVEYDKAAKTVQLSPLGIKYVEEKVSLEL